MKRGSVLVTASGGVFGSLGGANNSSSTTPKNNMIRKNSVFSSEINYVMK